MTLVKSGEVIGDVDQLTFRDPNNFVAGQLHRSLGNWDAVLTESQPTKRSEVWNWIENKVSIFPYFSHFKGSYKGTNYDSDRPPSKIFQNNVSCKPFATFIRETLLARLQTGAISLVGKVGQATPPFLVLPLTVEPSKPRLCHDARFLNLWMLDKPFSLDRIVDAPRYVTKHSYQTVLDDKSGYDHVLLSEESRTYFGIQWGGWYFMYNTLPFGWKISPYVYHSIGISVSSYLRTLGIPCLLYIDDRHNGQLQVDLNKGEYVGLRTLEEKNFAAAKSAIFLTAFHLIRLGYFLGLSKSILKPCQIVPYLGFLLDSNREVFHLIPEKKTQVPRINRRDIEIELGVGENSSKTGGQVCVLLPGCTSGTTLHKRDELGDFQRSTIQEESPPYGRTPKRDCSLALLKGLGQPLALARGEALPD